MRTLNYLGRIKTSGASRVIERYIGDKERQQQICDSMEFDEDVGAYYLDGFQTYESTHLIYTTRVGWHRDYNMVSSMLILQSDQHIIQTDDKTYTNRLCLKRGDLIRLNIGDWHRLYCKKAKPKLFIALVVEPALKTNQEAISFFTYYLPRLARQCT